MRIALAQLNAVIGDIEGNARKIIESIARAKFEGADLIVFPELALLGYPPKDLLLQPAVISDNVAAARRVAEAARGITALVGFAEPTNSATGRPLHNSVALCRDGKISQIHRKVLLPTYDVFDEDRYFEPGKEREAALVRDARGREWRIGVSICEDLWNVADMNDRLYARHPLRELSHVGAEIIVNASASPFVEGKEATRCALFTRDATEGGAPIVYANQVGGNDDLIFDGASGVFAPGRGVVARGKAFEEDFLIVEFGADGPRGRIEPYPDRLESIRAALVLGTHDYVRKCGFCGVVLGLSGGIDSALTAAIAVEALGADAVHGVAMPSRFSSAHSIEDAAALAERLGIDFRTLPIEEIHRSFERTLAAEFACTNADVTEENVQARIRGNLLMALSNKRGWLLLTTGNKSELAVGYCTLYGDMCGGLAVISDVPKTTVYDLSRYVNQRAGRALIPQRSIDKPPSAELRPDQTDQDTLPPYPVLDEILRRYIEELQSADEIVAAGFDPAVVRDVVRKVDRNEYKRKQAAVGLKVTSRAFGTGRRMPTAARFRA